jgi:hypothetical protein
MSERERNKEREEPKSRPIFTHDRDGLKHKAADRYLAGGRCVKARSNELQHLVISFNKPDRVELARLEPARGRGTKIERSKSGEAEYSKSGRSKADQEQVERDQPYVRAVRLMMQNLEERSGLKDLRYAMTVHRHTLQTHVHLVLRRECIDKATGEKRELVRLPKEFLNGRDERGKARGGILDISLSDALDTMIPRRQRHADAGVHSKSSPLSESESSLEKDRGQELISPEEHKEVRLERIKPLDFSRQRMRADGAETNPDASAEQHSISGKQIPATEKEVRYQASGISFGALSANEYLQHEDSSELQSLKSSGQSKDQKLTLSSSINGRANEQPKPQDRAIKESAHDSVQTGEESSTSVIIGSKYKSEAEYRAAIQKEIEEVRQKLERANTRSLVELLQQRTASSQKQEEKNKARPEKTGRGR